VRRRGQAGASLVVVLALTAFLAILVPAMLGLASTGYRVTSSSNEARGRLYVAASGLDAAIQHARTQDWVGAYGSYGCLDGTEPGCCPTHVVELDGLVATIRCSHRTARFQFMRTLRFDSFVEGEKLASAEVTLSPGRAPYVREWEVVGR
jgi:hypothetical protein